MADEAGCAVIRFWVSGRAVQKGNHKAVCPQCMFRRPGHPYIVDDWGSDLGRRLKAWCTRIVTRSHQHRPRVPYRGAVAVHLRFFYERPASNRSRYPISTRIPDGDKLTRAVWDALQCKGKQGGKVMIDDAQIVDWSGKLRWTFDDEQQRGEGCEVVIEPLEAEQLPLTDDAPAAINPRKRNRRTRKKSVSRKPSLF